MMLTMPMMQICSWSTGPPSLGGARAPSRGAKRPRRARPGYARSRRQARDDLEEGFAEEGLHFDLERREADEGPGMVGAPGDEDGGGTVPPPPQLAQGLEPNRVREDQVRRQSR